MKNILKNSVILLSLILITISCEKDLNTVGADFVGQDNFTLSEDISTEVISYNKKIDRVQTSALPSNLLGVYNDPIYGQTSANVLSQVILDRASPDFLDNPVVTEVVLSIPYFSTITDVDSEGNSTYELDSIFGETNTAYNLQVFRSNYFLRDFDPGSDGSYQDTQLYYSDEESNYAGQQEGDMLYPWDAVNHLNYPDFHFTPNNQEIVIDTTDDNGDVTTERLTPRLQLSLDPAYFQQHIVDTSETNPELLANANSFKDYFRGIYFKATPLLPNEGNMLLLDFSQAEIEIKFTYEVIESGRQAFTDDTFESNITMTFSGNTVNTLTQDDTFFGNTEVTNNDQLALRGGEASIAVIDLFGADTDGNGVSDQLDDWRSRDVLINQAILTFYVDTTAMTTQGDNEPDRLYLYDLDNNTPLLDYFLDSSSSDAVSSKINHSIPIDTDDSGYGVKYQMNITNHISSLVRKDSTNVSLGLAIAKNINYVYNSSAEITAEPDFEIITVSPINSPKGTVLYGNTTNVPDEKKVELKIYYTELD